MLPLRMQAEQQQVQAGALQLQAAQREAQYAQNWQNLWQSPTPPTNAAIAKALGPVAGPKYLEFKQTYEKNQAEIQAAKDKHAQDQLNYLGSFANAAASVKNDPGIVDTMLAAEEKNSDPDHSAMATKLRMQFRQDPSSIGPTMQQFLAMSPKQQEFATELKKAQISAGAGPSGLVAPEKLPGINAANALRLGVQQLPDALTLKEGDSYRDVDNIEKIVAGVESRKLREATLAQTKSLAEQGLDIRRDIAEQGKEAKERKWSMWQESDGRTVAGPLSQAEKEGGQNIAELPTKEVNDVFNARNAVKIMTKVGDPAKPETQGTLQLIDSLDRDGKLGILASRWNHFITTGVGASPGDDPRIITLIDKNLLGQTATMLTHFGASGGRSPLMLQHFLDQANAGKMDALTLRAGTKATVDYMQDKAMYPKSQLPGATTATPAGAGTKTPPPGTVKVGTSSLDGKQYYLDAQGKKLGPVSQ
jgi:hypothetical protein